MTRTIRAAVCAPVCTAVLFLVPPRAAAQLPQPPEGPIVVPAPSVLPADAPVQPVSYPPTVTVITTPVVPTVSLPAGAPAYLPPVPAVSLPTGPPIYPTTPVTAPATPAAFPYPQPAPGGTPSTGGMPPPAAAAPLPKPEVRTHEVGSDLNLLGVWDNGVVFQTQNKDWRIHLGGRLQFEPVFWTQSQRLKGDAPGSGGIPASGPGAGVGALDDGMFFRRVRLKADGVGYEMVEFAFEVAFEQLNFTTYDHMWVGLKDVPFLGTVRVGQHKVPQGLEMMSSDYHLQLLERSSLADAFWTLFAPGVFVSNNYLDNHLIAQTMFHRIQPVGFFTSDFGDGDYASTSRVVLLPVYAHDGACVVHVGGSYQWRRADLGRSIQPGGTGSAFADSQSVVRFRARPELRDATGIGTTLGGDAARFVDTGFLLARSVQTVSPEFLWIQGPLSVQAEGAWSFVRDAQSVYPAAALGTPRGNPMFWGGYVETSYFLTGEHRGYDRRMGTFDRPKVAENAFFVRGEDGRFHYGIGAWQLAYRYSYLDLNDNGINGGQLGQHTLGLNWYLNDNLKVQFQYSNIQRNVIDPAVSGTVHGYGMLVQWYF